LGVGARISRLPGLLLNLVLGLVTRSGALAELMPGAVIAAQRKNADSFMTEVGSFVTFWHIPNLNGRVECPHILQE
jgi:hypothetical protein